MKQPTIYLAEDEKNIRTLLTSFLVKENYHVKAFETGDELYDEFVSQPADLVILDVMMPGSNGFIICSKIRAISTIPIIFLTARDSDEDFISGMTLGSDIYFTKPFSMTKFIVQVKAMLRRVELNSSTTQINEEENCLKYNDIVIIQDQLTVNVGKNELKLTHTEYELLNYLISNKNRAISRKELLDKIWGYDAIIETRATDDTVKRLRKKLSVAKSRVSIQTIRGYGFKLGEIDV